MTDFELTFKQSQEDQLNRFKKLVNKHYILKRTKGLGKTVEIISVNNVYRQAEEHTDIIVEFDKITFISNGPVKEIKQVRGCHEGSLEVYNLSFIFPMDGWEKKEVDYFVARNYIDIFEDVCLNGLGAAD